MMVSHGNEVNVVLPEAIDDAVGKAQNDPFAQPTRNRCARLRIGRDAFYRVLHRYQEPQAKTVEVGIVELH